MAATLHKPTMTYRPRQDTFVVKDDPDYLINPDLTAVSGVPQKYWKLDGDSIVEMTQPEKDVVDAAELAAGKTARVAQLDAEAKVLIVNRFPPERQASVTAHRDKATADGLTNRAAHAQLMWDWITAVVVYTHGIEDTINASDDPAGETWDLAPYDTGGATPPPAVTIRSTLAITD